LTTVTKELIETFISKTEMFMYSTHHKLCVPIVNRIYKKMVAGIKFPGIKVHKNKICDGHHRYLASMLAQMKMDADYNNMPFEKIVEILK